MDVHNVLHFYFFSLKKRKSTELYLVIPQWNLKKGKEEK